VKKNTFIEKNLESQMVTYNTLLSVAKKDNKENFVKIDTNKIPTKKNIFVRKSIYEKLLKVQSELVNEYPSYSLLISCGYRNLDLQIKKFIKQLKKVNIYFEDPLDLYEEIHRYVAVPAVAGHPTGGAIDIIIINAKTGLPLNFGNKQYDYSTKNCYVFSPNISDVARKNRMLLRKYMTKEGFAPFDGEWWHFSYGDREWAFYYKKPYAIYDQLNEEKIQKL
jgi:zinc D-Ala-D-Ala dipeptidase